MRRSAAPRSNGRISNPGSRRTRSRLERRSCILLRFAGLNGVFHERNRTIRAFHVNQIEVTFYNDIGREIGPDSENERDLFGAYCAQIVSFDAKNRTYNAIWERFPHEIRVLLNKRCIRAVLEFSERGRAGSDWEARFARSRQVVASAMERRD